MNSKTPGYLYKSTQRFDKNSLECGRAIIESLEGTRMTISLNQLLPIENQKEYKVHIASKDKSGEPLDVFVQDKKNWKSWNEWRSENNDFNQKYIFSMMDFYHEKDTWLFGGIYEVLPGGSGKPGEGGYKVREIEHAREFIGRLKIFFKRPRRGSRSLTMGRYYGDMTVSEILKEQYSGEKFCGYENINHEFGKLEAISNNQRLDWKTALENVNGIYAIHDTSNGKKYVGAAYSDEGGVWARWSSYIKTGHGGNTELKKLIKEKGKDYAKTNFVFSLLEYRPMSTDRGIVTKRENYWKKVLLSRDFGYNKN